MTNIIAIAVSLAVFALGGYWLGGAKKDQAPAFSVASVSKKPPKLCKPSDPSCETDVTVVWDTCPSNCFPAVLEDVIVAKAGTKITWNVKHEKYKFAADGIAFGSDAGTVTCNAGPKKFDCTTDATKLGVFKYTINLVSQDGSGNPPALDPYVVNN